MGTLNLEYEGKEPKDRIINSTNAANLKMIENYAGTTLSSYNETWKNMLIFGDNLPVLKHLYDDKKIRGKIKLIYIDPPFSTKQEFTTREQEDAYQDLLVGPDFVEFIRKRLIFLRELLAEDGTLYVHLDQKMGHYIKIVLDEIFGQENFRNDITRIKCNPKNFQRKAYGNVKDVIYFYSKVNKNGNSITWNDVTVPLDEDEIEQRFAKIDANGRRYTTTPVHAKGETKNGATGQKWRDMLPPAGRHWRYSPNELDRLDREGLIEWSKTGNPRKMLYADETIGKKVQDVWEFKDPGRTREAYPTQKNEDLLDFIIRNSSNEGDLVLDCFCGSGTTLQAAEKLGRKWIGIDNSETAIKTAKVKILELSHPKSFQIFESI